MRLTNGLIRASPFRRSVIQLTSFTVIGQAVALLITPVISRLFPVAVFGQMALIGSITYMLLYATAWRYEIAILLPVNDEEAEGVFYCGIIAVICSSAMAMVVYLATTAFSGPRGRLGFLATYGWIIPFTLLLGGVSLCYSHMAMRKKAIRQLSYCKVLGPSASLVMQLAGGAAGGNPLGLFLSDGAGSLCRTATLLSVGPRHGFWESWHSGRIWRAGLRYKAYPLYGVWGVFLSSISRYILPSVIVILYGDVQAGYYSLVVRIMAAPVELIGRGYTEAFLGEAASLLNGSGLQLKRLFVRSGVVLFIIGIPPSLLLMVAGPQVFAFLFGKQWYAAGVLAQYMAFLVPFAFVNYPLVHTLGILGKPRWQSAWDAGIVSCVVAGVIFVKSTGISCKHALAGYATLMSLFFCLHYILSLHALNCEVRRRGI